MGERYIISSKPAGWKKCYEDYVVMQYSLAGDVQICKYEELQRRVACGNIQWAAKTEGY